MVPPGYFQFLASLCSWVLGSPGGTWIPWLPVGSWVKGWESEWRGGTVSQPAEHSFAEIVIHHMDWAIQDWAPGGCRWGQLEADKLIR
jgi:hypothetical protein